MMMRIIFAVLLAVIFILGVHRKVEVIDWNGLPIPIQRGDC